MGAAAVWTANPAQLRSLAAWITAQEESGCGDGIDGAILEAGLGSFGTVLEANRAKAGRIFARCRELCTWHRLPIEPWARGRKMMMPMPTFGEAADRLGVDLNFVPDVEQRCGVR